MPKLPADLPENWTQGQTISPNGTEVGLTEQYGYNYLMKQVNDTQTEVNNINDTLQDVAQQTTVNEIKNKIGTESDADTQPTLFGRLAQLKKVLLENLAELLTKVTGIDGKIGNTDDTTGSAKVGSVMGKLNALFTVLSGGVVVWDTAGTYEWTVPAGVTKIKVSGAGAGAGAGGAASTTFSSLETSKTTGGGGGGAGEAVKDKEFTVTPGSKLSITVGKHGVGGKGKVASNNGEKADDGTAGGATVVGELITLAGGLPGKGATYNQSVGTATVGTGGEPGGIGGSRGEDGFWMTWQTDKWGFKNSTKGTGGKTIFGDIGEGGTCYYEGSLPGKTEYDRLAIKGGDGKDGYVSISWGV